MGSEISVRRVLRTLRPGMSLLCRLRALLHIGYCRRCFYCGRCQYHGAPCFSKSGRKED